MAMKASMTVFLFGSLFGVNISVYRKHIYVGDGMTWSDAQMYCKKHHDDLSTVTNSELARLSLNPKVSFEFYWIGLRRDFQKPSVWRWTGGEEATDLMWSAGQPDTLHEQCAVVSKSNNKVHDTACFLSMPFYCMEDLELILVEQESTWDEALEHCRQKYNDLAVLSSDAVMTEVRNKNAPALTDDVWIGLRFTAGHWFWLNGKDVVYKAWSVEGEPQCPAPNQRCGVLERKTMCWKPANCEQRLNFLCVKKHVTRKESH